MKISFTRQEVENIVLDYVQQNFVASFNEVIISDYNRDYCVVSRDDQKVEECSDE